MNLYAMNCSAKFSALPTKEQYGFPKQKKKDKGASKDQERLTKIIKKRGNVDFQNRRRRTKTPTGKDKEKL